MSLTCLKSLHKTKKKKNEKGVHLRRFGSLPFFYSWPNMSSILGFLYGFLGPTSFAYGKIETLVACK